LCVSYCKITLTSVKTLPAGRRAGNRRTCDSFSTGCSRAMRSAWPRNEHESAISTQQVLLYSFLNLSVGWGRWSTQGFGRSTGIKTRCSLYRMGRVAWYSDWLRAGRSGDQIPVGGGAKFSAPVQTGPGTHPASCTMCTGSFPGVKSGRGVTLTPHPLLVLWS